MSDFLNRVWYLDTVIYDYDKTLYKERNVIEIVLRAYPCRSERHWESIDFPSFSEKITATGIGSYANDESAPARRRD